VLSGRAGAGDKIGALDVGADDYVTKPFAMGELLARLGRSCAASKAAQPWASPPER
jgi:DNA-binding response OmpR family regulator